MDRKRAAKKHDKGCSLLTIFADEYILWFQVSIDDALLMKMGQSEGNLGREELCLVLWEHAHFDQVTEQFTTLHELHQEVDTILVLEHILHVHEEWVIDRAQNIFLKLYVLHLLILQNDVLSDALHGIKFLGGYVFDKEHLTEGALSNHFADLEVL